MRIIRFFRSFSARDEHYVVMIHSDGASDAYWDLSNIRHTTHEMRNKRIWRRKIESVSTSFA